MIKDNEYETKIIPMHSILINELDNDVSVGSVPLLKKIKSNSAAGSIIQHTFGILDLVEKKDGRASAIIQ